MSTIRDVARLSGYSVATVSRVINRSGYVGKETERAIAQAMKELNYVPSVTARSLAGKGSSTAALIIPDILNPFFPEVARAIEDKANEYGFTVMLCNSDNDADKERRYFEVLANKKVDGIIIASYSRDQRHIAAFAKQSGIPLVVIDNPIEGGAWPVIHADHRGGGRLAASHLLERGCRKIGHLSGPAHIPASRERRAGYEEICRESGTTRDPSLVVECGFYADEGVRGVLELLSRHPDIDGVFASNDLLAAGALKGLMQAGKRVPEEIKLIGFDGIPIVLMPELSTVVQPVYALGSEAMGALIELIEGKEAVPGSRVMAVELAARHTTR